MSFKGANGTAPKVNTPLTLLVPLFTYKYLLFASTNNLKFGCIFKLIIISNIELSLSIILKIELIFKLPIYTSNFTIS